MTQVQAGPSRHAPGAQHMSSADGCEAVRSAAYILHLNPGTGIPSEVTEEPTIYYKEFGFLALTSSQR